MRHENPPPTPHLPSILYPHLSILQGRFCSLTPSSYVVNLTIIVFRLILIIVYSPISWLLRGGWSAAICHVIFSRAFFYDKLSDNWRVSKSVNCLNEHISLITYSNFCRKYTSIRCRLFSDHKRTKASKGLIRFSSKTKKRIIKLLLFFFHSMRQDAVLGHDALKNKNIFS